MINFKLSGYPFFQVTGCFFVVLSTSCYHSCHRNWTASSALGSKCSVFFQIQS